MAKEAGFAFTVTVDDSAGSGRDISNDIMSLAISTPRGSQDITGLDKSAVERILLLADGQVTLDGAFNPATNMSHDVFKRVSTTSVTRTVALAISGQTLSMEMLFTDYALTRANTGELTWSAPAQLSNGTAPTWS